MENEITVLANTSYEELDKILKYKGFKVVEEYTVDDHIYIEVEDDCKTIGVKYDSVDSMIKELDSYDLPYEKNNYFVKKAEIKLKETMK